jgi:hypothetical protein
LSNASLRRSKGIESSGWAPHSNDSRDSGEAGPDLENLHANIACRAILRGGFSTGKSPSERARSRFNKKISVFDQWCKICAVTSTYEVVYTQPKYHSFAHFRPLRRPSDCRHSQLSSLGFGAVPVPDSSAPQPPGAVRLHEPPLREGKMAHLTGSELRLRPVSFLSADLCRRQRFRS